jgi:hypothetical protein
LLDYPWSIFLSLTSISLLNRISTRLIAFSRRWLLVELNFLEGQEVRPLQNIPFCPIPASGSNFNPPPSFGGLILKILNVFQWLKSSPSLDLNKIERFSKVSRLKNGGWIDLLGIPSKIFKCTYEIISQCKNYVVLSWTSCIAFM